MPLPLVFDVICRAIGGELSTNDNREYLLLQPTDGTGTGDVVPNGGPLKVTVQDVAQQGLFVEGTSYRVTIAALP